jgi:hypothetical protein
VRGILLVYTAPKLSHVFAEGCRLKDLNPDQLFLALGIQAYIFKHGLQADATLVPLPKWVAKKPIMRAEVVRKLVEPLKQSSSAFPNVCDN